MRGSRNLLLAFLCALVAASVVTTAGSATQPTTAKATLVCDKGVLDAIATVELRLDSQSFPAIASADLHCGESISDVRDRAKIVAPEPFGFVLWNWGLVTDAGGQLCLSGGGVFGAPLSATCQLNGAGPAITVTVK